MSLPMNSTPATSGSRFQLSSVAFFGRTLAEYLQMLALEQEGLRGLKILDVASGPGSFIAEALAMGLDATGCDPMYDGDPEAIRIYRVEERQARVDAKSVKRATADRQEGLNHLWPP